MKYRTVELELTNPKENIGDLMNILALVSFRAGWPKKHVLLNLEKVIDEQYTLSILKSEIHQPTALNKPQPLS